RRLEPSRNLPVGIGNTQPVSRIVRPWRPIERGCSAVKSIVMEEVVVDDDCTPKPVRAPAPTTPAVPATKTEHEVNGRHPAKSEYGIVERRVITPRRRSPDVRRVVHRHVDYVGAGGLNDDSRLAALSFRADSLLRRGGQTSPGLG